MNPFLGETIGSVNSCGKHQFENLGTECRQSPRPAEPNDEAAN